MRTVQSNSHNCYNFYSKTTSEPAFHHRSQINNQRGGEIGRASCRERV